jgi:hypothetical protein
MPEHFDHFNHAIWVPNLGVRSGYMPHVRLTDMSISKLPPSKPEVTYWDEGLPAFGVRVGLRRKTFIVVVNHGHRVRLGHYPLTSLKDARGVPTALRSERGKGAGECTYGRESGREVPRDPSRAFAAGARAGAIAHQASAQQAQ